MNTIRLNNGVLMPDFGLGTFHSTDERKCAEAVGAAVRMGYRMIDTARIYCNEEIIGRALDGLFGEGFRREDIFVVTKVWFDDYEDVQSIGLDKNLGLCMLPFCSHSKSAANLQ